MLRVPHLFDGVEEIASLFCEIIRLVVDDVRSVDVSVPPAVLDFERPEVRACARLRRAGSEFRL